MRRKPLDVAALLAMNPRLAARIQQEAPHVARKIGLDVVKKAARGAVARRVRSVPPTGSRTVLPPEVAYVAGPGGHLRLFIPGMRLVSEHNQVLREGRWDSRRRIRQQHDVMGTLLKRVPRPEWSPLLVRMIRWGGRSLDQNGNLQSSTKAVQDEIARWLGIDDRHEHLVRYRTEQCKRPKGSRWNYAVEIFFSEDPDASAGAQVEASPC